MLSLSKHAELERTDGFTERAEHCFDQHALHSSMLRQAQHARHDKLFVLRGRASLIAQQCTLPAPKKKEEKKEG